MLEDANEIYYGFGDSNLNRAKAKITCFLELGYVNQGGWVTLSSEYVASDLVVGEYINSFWFDGLNGWVRESSTSSADSSFDPPNPKFRH